VSAQCLFWASNCAAIFWQILPNVKACVQVLGVFVAHLQIGRAYAMAGDNANARVAYQDFLTLWKDADPDVPILKQAKAEYAKLPPTAETRRASNGTSIAQIVRDTRGWHDQMADQQLRRRFGPSLPRPSEAHGATSMMHPDG
jgi:hypothetical protein